MIGAVIRYCGHVGCFTADVYTVGNAVVVNAGGPLFMENLDRSPQTWDNADYHLIDFPVAGFWKPQKGIFVVPASQLKRVKGQKK